MKKFDWSKPQRQPAAALAVVFADTFWEILKRAWPFLLILFLGKPGETGRQLFYIGGFLTITIVSAVLRYFHFKFYIERDNLIIKKGWIKKEMKVIPLEKIQSVHVEQGPVHQLLKIVKLSIDTAGSQKAEATIDALRKPMAEALRLQLLIESGISEIDNIQKKEEEVPVVKLGDKDLLRLSLSANHLETFFIILAFGVGMYDNLTSVDNAIFSGIQDYLPQGTLYPFVFLTVAILLITILVSTGRIFFKFYDLTVFHTKKGLRITSGITHLKEKLVNFKKLQFISWKTSWIRKPMNIWLLQYHVAGGDELKNKLKVQVPVTQLSFIPLLTQEYHSLPDTGVCRVVKVHPSYIWRRVLITGLLPCVIAGPFLYLLWDEKAFLVLALPLLIFWGASLFRKKFRLWAMEDVLYIRTGVFGEERKLLLWYKIQSVQLRQNIFQRKKHLASIVLHTAGGSINIPYIPLEAARQVLNYSLFQVESQNKPWN